VVRRMMITTLVINLTHHRHDVETVNEDSTARIVKEGYLEDGDVFTRTGASSMQSPGQLSLQNNLIMFPITQHPLYSTVRDQPHECNKNVETSSNPLFKKSRGNCQGIQEGGQFTFDVTTNCFRK
jgi:hypothetical protein